MLSGPSNVLTGPNATGGIAQFGPYGGNYAEVSQANLYGPYLTPREWILTDLTASYPAGNWSPPPDFLLQGDSLPNFNLGHTRMAGIALTPGRDGNQILTLYKGSSEFFTQSDLPFGNASTVFITGVAFQDSNSNGRYDPGEGIAGVTITPDHGGWYAVTSSSGGYAFPVPANAGSYILTAAGGPFNGATATVVVGGDSVKFDWVLPAAATALPPQITLPPADGTHQIMGISARGLVQTGDDVLIGGFSIEGPASVQKKLLIRGVGPSLQTVGVPANECIPATQIQINSSSTIIASNQGWTTVPDGGVAAAQAAAQVGDFPLVNWAGGGGDSALVVTLPPGAYTVVASPAAGAPPEFQTGRMGLVEIYDLSPGDGSRFTSFSSRGLVGTGDSRMIIGCALAGSGHERLLVRASGPALASAFAPAVTLPDPILTLFDKSGSPLAFNDDWSNSAQTSQISALTAEAGALPFPPGSVDAALLAFVPSGNYTTVAGAKAGTAAAGLAMIEMYETP